jgi:hypothetical protein
MCLKELGLSFESSMNSEHSHAENSGESQVIWKMVLPLSMPIEALMEATESIIPASCDYSEWEERFHSNQDKCIPLVEEDASKSFASDCEKLLRRAHIKSDVAYYGLYDYVGLFTVQLIGGRVSLESIRRGVLSSASICIGLPEDVAASDRKPVPVWDQHQEPCRFWLNRCHASPVWPPPIEAVSHED